LGPRWRWSWKRTRTAKASRSAKRWTYLWLWYFEDWLASGVWKGGCRHPQLSEKPS
jgi:hypothetical protein